MTLYDLIYTLKDIALKLPNVRTFAEGSIYDIMNGKNDVEYDCIVLSQDTHRADESFNYFTFNIFYISRLVSDMEENRLQVQSLGIEVLNNLFNILSDKYDIEIENNIQYNSFTQKFKNECCGVYASLVLNVPKEFLCAEQLFSDNSTPIISIKNVSITKEYTENGEYNITYDSDIYTGIDKVKVKVAVDYTDELNSAREEGYNQGNAEGYAKGTQDGYDNGYAVGEELGYNNGLEVGKEEQKALLESITITKNGTYTKDDGYSEVIVSIGEDGKDYTYTTNFVDEDGLKAIGWTDDDIAWFKSNTPHYDWENENYVVSESNKALYGVITKDNISNYKDNPDLVFLPKINGTLNYNHLNKIKNLKGVPYFEFSGNTNDLFEDCYSLETIPPLNLTGTLRTSDMFLNCHKLKTIPIFDMSSSENTNSMFSDCYSLTTIPELDFSNAINCSNCFGKCYSLISIPKLNLSKCENITQMFQYCYNLSYIPQLDLGNVTNAQRMFTECRTLKKLPYLNLGKCTTMNHLLWSCSGLEEIEGIDTSSATNVQQMLYSCTSLKKIPQMNFGNVTSIGTFFGYSDIKSVTECGGFVGLKINWNDGYGINRLPNLDYQSCLNIVNGLWDFSGTGETRILKVNANFLTTIGEDISIAINKGWEIIS